MTETKRLLMALLFLMSKERRKIPLENVLDIMKKLIERHPELEDESVLESIKELEDEGVIEVRLPFLELTGRGEAVCGKTYAECWEREKDVLLDALLEIKRKKYGERGGCA